MSAIATLLTPPLRRGLTHFWTLDGHALDQVDPAGNGTPVGVIYTTPKLGSGCAVATNGTIITAVNGPTGSTAFSWSIWVNQGAKTPSAVGGWGSGYGTSFYAIRDTDNVILTDGVGTHFENVLVAVSEGVWKMLTVTYDGTDLKVYSNGSLHTTRASVTLATAAGVIRFADSPRNPGTWPGFLAIDDSCMWSRALTVDEVTSLYNAGAGIETLTGSLLTGLVHQWHFNGNSTDSVGSANGTDTAIVYGGKVGSACGAFGGASRVVTSAAGPSGNAPRTYSMWLYPTIDADAGILTHGAAPYGMIVRYSSGLTYFSNGTPVCGVSVPKDAWSFLAWTYDGANGRMYINDGAPVVAACSPGTEAGTITFGAFYVPSIGIDFTGHIDEVGIYNRALGAVEVAQLYNAGAGRRP
jgi:hypothetical protein